MYYQNAINSSMSSINIFVIFLFFFFSSDTYASYTRDRHKHLHSYHNIVVRNINSTNGILPYFGLYRAVYQIGGDEVLPITNCDPPPTAIEDFPGTIFPGRSS